MFYTLTLNPAIDQMISVDKFKISETNLVQEQYQICGGKGINVSVMLKNLGYDNIALGFIATNDAALFYQYLQLKKIKSKFHQINGRTRLNLKIKDLNNQQETELNCLGFKITTNDEQAILKLIKKHVQKTDILIISGSIALGTKNHLYQVIAEFCWRKKITFVIDSTKINLMTTLAFRPLLVKPNLAELNEIFNTKVTFTNIKQVVALAQKLIKLGAQNVLVSNGREGSLLVTKNYSYLANAASGTLVNSVGAGDSMVAGFIGTFISTKDFKKSLLIAVAAGSSTAFSQGIGELKLIEKLKKQIKITLLE